MTTDEYKLELKKLHADFELLKKELAIKYAMANNPVEIGDIVKDHKCKIKVDKIDVTIINSIPTCMYHGVELKVDNTPKKNNSRDTVYQINLDK